VSELDELGLKVAGLEQLLRKLATGDMLSSSSVGFDDPDDEATAPVLVGDALVSGNEAAGSIPQLQDDIDEHATAISDLGNTIADTMDELDERFALAAVDLEVAREEIDESQEAIRDAFGQQVEGLSGDVDAAIKAAGSAKTEAEAASEAALAAAGLAASKGETIVQISAPTGSRATAANLWIDISTNAAGVPKNQPNRYNPDTAKWEPITDAQAVAAAQAAATAAAAAQAAKNVAAQASAAAGVAQQTATDANTAALAAAGIANGKGKVIYQLSKPTGTNAAVGNLWIRSSDNTPWAYDTSKADWVQVTDKAATDAASAAAAANQAAVAASNAAKAAQATADSKPLILFSDSAGPSGTAPTGTIWFLWDTAKNVAGQWLQSGTLAAPVWTPQQIRSEVIANLDVAKLTAGSAAIAALVAQKIAAATANFQTVNVSNLFVASGATMSQAVIDYLFANVVQAKKITAGMIDVTTFNGVTLTGTVYRSAASGQRIEIQGTSMRVFDATGAQAGVISGDAGGLRLVGGISSNFYVGERATGTPYGPVGCYAPSIKIDVAFIGDRLFDQNGNQWWTSQNGLKPIMEVQGLTATNIRADGFFIGGVDAQLGDTGWIQPALAGGTNDADSPFRYRRLNGVIYFDGLVAPTATNQRMFVLPAGFRPARIRRAWIDRNGTTTPTQWIVRVHSGGAIDLIGPSGGSGALDFGGYPPFPAS